MKIVNRYFIRVVLLLFLTACNATDSSNKEAVMLKGTEKKYVIFSPMEGVLLKDGKPLAHTKIIRTLRWNGNDDTGLVEEFSTDENGNFLLPLHEEVLSLGMLSQFVAKAELQVAFFDDIIDIWYNNKFTGDLYAETKDKLMNLFCDITADEITVNSGQSTILTLCRWDEMPK